MHSIAEVPASATKLKEGGGRGKRKGKGRKERKEKRGKKNERREGGKKGREGEFSNEKITYSLKI